MKIALLAPFHPFRGGIAQFSNMLYGALENDHELSPFSFKRQYPNFLFPGTSQYVVDDGSPDPIKAEPILDSINPFSFKTSAKKINETHPELFISQYWMTFFGPSLGVVQKNLNKEIKRISILHNVIPHEKRFYDKWANNYFLKQNEGFVVLSDAVLNDLLSLKPDAKYLRIDHPVYDQYGEKKKRSEALLELNLSEDNKYILFFGIIRDYKGLDLLIKSLTFLPDDYQIIVAGEVYGSFDKYAQLIESTGTKDRVHLYNHYISDDEVALYFSAADVCVLPYKDATQSGITAISHNFELPVIATDVGGLKENTEHLKTGLIVEKPDSELIAKSITQYFDEDLKEKMSKNIAIEKAENSWGNFAEKLVEFAKTL